MLAGGGTGTCRRLGALAAKPGLDRLPDLGARDPGGDDPLVSAETGAELCGCAGYRAHGALVTKNRHVGIRGGTRSNYQAMHSLSCTGGLTVRPHAVTARRRADKSAGVRRAQIIAGKPPGSRGGGPLAPNT